MTGVRRGAIGLTLLGLAGLIGLFWMSFFWVSTEANQGVVQRIFYVHVPAAWTSFLAIGVAALCSAVYLWLRDDKLDRAAMCAADDPHPRKSAFMSVAGSVRTAGSGLRPFSISLLPIM